MDGCEIKISGVEEYGGKTEGDMASVASSASLMSPLLKRSPTVDEACPPWICFMAGE